jgi:uncharacterized protein involved in exopolysaccharide biosynthesis
VNFFARVLSWRPLPWTAAGALMALVMLWTFTTTPRYRSAALLQVQPQEPSGGLNDALTSVPGGALLGLSRDGLETEMGVLRSRRVIDAVIDSLALTARRVSPVAGRDSLVSVRLVDGPEPEGTLVFTREGNGYAIAAEELVPALTLPASIAPGDSFVVGNAHIQLRSDLGESAPRRFMMQLTPRYSARRALLDRLEMLRPSTGAQLIAVTFDDADPQVAARALEVMIGEYMRYTSRAAGGDAQATAAELRRQLDTLSRALGAAEDAVRRYQERTGLVVPEEQAAAQVKRYAVLRGQLDALAVERDALARMLTIVRERSVNGTRTGAYRQLATFPTLISNRAIQDLLVALTELENDRSALLLLRSEQNADVRQLTDRITEIETQLQQLGMQYLEALDGQLTPLRASLARIDTELLALPERQMVLVRLLREQKILGEGYVALEKQVRQTEILDAIRRDAIRVVDAPVEAHPDDPQFPKPAVHFVLALVLGMSVAGGLVALRAAVSPATSA